MNSIVKRYPNCTMESSRITDAERFESESYAWESSEREQRLRNKRAREDAAVSSFLRDNASQFREPSCYCCAVVRIIIPRQVDSLHTRCLGNEISSRKLSIVPLGKSRFVWNAVHPCIFGNASDRIVRQMMVCLLHVSSKTGNFYQIPIHKDKLSSPVENSKMNPFYERVLHSYHLPSCRRRRKCTLLILPPFHQPIEYSWEERVIYLEHQFIRAQSMAGFYSTLGGGFFMTRRLQTAAALARQQKRIALMLGNKEMYYKCTINQAYSHIYAGEFKLARQLILEVWIALAHEKHFDDKLVLQNMCQSAMLFRKRVRAAMKRVPVIQGGQSRLVDDFSRIRVVQDQSSHNDFSIFPLVR